MANEQTNSQGSQIDGRRPAESEKPRPIVNRPTVPPEEVDDKEVKKAEQEAKKAEDEAAKAEAKAGGDNKKGGKFHYFRNMQYAGLTLQVQKTTKDRDGKDVQEVDEQATFTQYFDKWKGDTVRVGYLKTDSEKLAKAAEADPYVEKIDQKDYEKAVGTDDKPGELEKAPVAAV